MPKPRMRWRRSGRIGRPVGMATGRFDVENRPAFFFHWLALNALGASVVPINPQWRSAELEYSSHQDPESASYRARRDQELHEPESVG